MQILDVNSVVFPEVKVIRYGRFIDERGFFTETYRKSDLHNHPALGFLNDLEIVQTNVSYSKKWTVRGLHFQWNPYMGKLVRVVEGRLIDLFLDIRKGSPTFGKIGAWDKVATTHEDWSSWIWIPVGFAHGGVFTEDTLIEYFCTAEYSPNTEAGISPIADDIDWSLCGPRLKKEIDQVINSKPLMSEKDRKGYTLKEWLESPDSENFIYSS